MIPIVRLALQIRFVSAVNEHRVLHPGLKTSWWWYEGGFDRCQVLQWTDT
jgi:hypothetical protein